jgi:hypothetical protein
MKMRLNLNFELAGARSGYKTAEAMTKKLLLMGHFGLAVGLLGIGTLGADEGGWPGEGIGLSLSAGLDSHYVSEGRDNLDGDSLFGATLEGEAGGLIGGVWYANSPDTDYRELNLYTGYGMEVGAFEVTVGYTYLDFLSDDADDSEVGAGVAYGELPWGLTAALEGYYSFEAEGAFFEASLSAEHEVEEWLTLAPSIILGWNEGYIAEGHDGANHLAVLLEATFALAETVELGLYAACSWALDADPGVYADDALLDDFIHGGIVFTFSK